MYTSVYMYVCVCDLIFLCSHFQSGVVGSDGYTPLGLAVQNGKLKVMKYLITEQNIDPKGTVDPRLSEPRLSGTSIIRNLDYPDARFATF